MRHPTSRSNQPEVVEIGGPTVCGDKDPRAIRGMDKRTYYGWLNHQQRERDHYGQWRNAYYRGGPPKFDRHGNPRAR